ncbi:hypothetical protein SAMN04488033_11654 [Salegentibacter agarivorans]|uniref:Beta-carotene 15,15'-monooxygenase n=1 Tax=Salegentibacter agarivorans TaxID=345907 RepID=A0A1I2N2E1_9FLAO|nr:hypothetical protein [Salegentibacter agarivorans]SFF95561.1 hypothetical protein SAMN04488033_11654 [Salegentibacter agarivorans]
MTNLKNLTVLKNTKQSSEPSSKGSNDYMSYHNQGFGASKGAQGNINNLKASLNALFQSYERKCKEGEEEQVKLKQPYLTEKKGKTTALNTKYEDLGKLEGQEEVLEERIEKLKQDKIDVKRDPEKYGVEVDSKASAKFWIGLALIIPLTLYIFIFYISTSFSGFFRTFDPSTDLFGGMFYPKALTEAWEAGILEFGFVIFIPFVFFGLGYLIHMFQQKNGFLNYFKIGMLFVVTFLFDAILAYLIEEKLYDLNKSLTDPPFSVSYALESPGFWVIIFAGFISYIIWGLVFDFIMHEHSDRDKIKKQIAAFNKEIKNLKEKIEKIKIQIEVVKEDIKNLEVRISELDSIIEGFIFPIKDYKYLASKYLEGWMYYISSELPLGKSQKDKLLEECHLAYDKHLQENDLDGFTSQNQIFKKSS